MKSPNLAKSPGVTRVCGFQVGICPAYEPEVRFAFGRIHILGGGLPQSAVIGFVLLGLACGSAPSLGRIALWGGVHRINKPP